MTLLAAAIAAAVSVQAADTTQSKNLEEVIVISQATSYANSLVTEGMIKQQNPITSIAAVIDNLPGVLVNEGDVFGSDDWATTISIRGFQLSLDEQQIGTTVDGIPNGNSGYGGGSKANRYIDTPNLAGVQVSQGTANISSRSHEALGGTLNFTTIDPEVEQGMRVDITSGDFDAQKTYLRYNTGEFLPGTYAWISGSSSDVNASIDESGEANREHFAAKIIREGDVRWTGYLAYDDIHEDNYERITLQEFRENPDWDRLTGNWTGIPYIDQQYRRGWSTLRENLLGYVRAEFTPAEGVDVNIAAYYHDQEGRGDWIPPYIVDVTSDGPGQPHSELNTGTVFGGAPLGTLFFVDSAGVALSPTPGCVSSITWPYGGAGPEYDPACYPAGALPVSSYRTTNYEKQRHGLTGDLVWTLNTDIADHTLSAGFWYEDYTREENRTWQKVIDSRSGYQFNTIPYWMQYRKEFPVDTWMFYVQDTAQIGPLALTLGAKKYLVDLEQRDLFTGASSAVDSDSDVLFSGGLVFDTAMAGLQLFAGYAENFAAIKDDVLEADGSALSGIEPETADNIDLGARFGRDDLNLTLTYYQIEFENRITFIPPGTVSGIDYLIGTNGSYLNVGGIESEGIEASVTWMPHHQWTLYLSYTNNDSTYQGTGSAALDNQVGIVAGNTVFGSAEQMFVASADWASDSYFAGISGKWVDERWMDPANTQRIDDYWVTDVYAGVGMDNLAGDLVKGFEVRFIINNLADEDYIGGVSGGWGGWIGGPRTAAVSVSADF